MGDFCCAKCKKPIRDNVVQAMGRSWHPEHFTCAHCKKPIQEDRYHVLNNLPYCQADYTKLYLKRCCKCGEPICDVVVMALGKPWHKDHFNCVGCGVILTQMGFFDHNDKPYCQQCYEMKICVKCAKCGKPILGIAVVNLNKNYHPECFCCDSCQQPVNQNQFRMRKDKVICQTCEAR